LERQRGENGVRVSKVLKAVLGFTREVVIVSAEVIDGDRPRLRVRVRAKQRRRGRCGRCGEPASWLDNGGGERSWRHLDAGFATVEITAVARRVTCTGCGPTVAAVPWARHNSAFTRAFEDVVVHDAVVGNKQAAAERYGTSGIPSDRGEIHYEEMSCQKCAGSTTRSSVRARCGSFGRPASRSLR
jgi:hypothetical protein